MFGMVNNLVILGFNSAQLKRKIEKISEIERKLKEYIESGNLRDLLELKNRIKLQTSSKIEIINLKIRKLASEIKELEKENDLENKLKLRKQVVIWICYLRESERSIEKNANKIIDQIDAKIDFIRKKEENEKKFRLGKFETQKLNQNQTS